MLIFLILIHIKYTLSRIARRAEQGARPAIPSQVAVEKIATEKQNTPNLLVSKKSMIFGSLNTQTLQRKWKVPELVSSAEKTRHDNNNIMSDKSLLDSDSYTCVSSAWKTCSWLDHLDTMMDINIPSETVICYKVIFIIYYA